MGKLIISILIMVVSLVFGILPIIRDMDSKVLNIVLGILNLIVSAFNFTIYDKCLSSMNCNENSVTYIDGKGLVSSCLKQIDMHSTAYGMYVTMIILLIASILFPIIIFIKKFIN